MPGGGRLLLEDSAATHLLVLNAPRSFQTGDPFIDRAVHHNGGTLVTPPSTRSVPSAR